MKQQTPQQRFAIKDKKKKQLASAYPDLKAQSGIYMFYRIVAYIGKSAEKDGILGRCASHCVEHQQHIDNSIHSRKLSCEGGQWFIKPLIYCSPSEVDKYEREFIEKYNGVYQLLNKESGGTDGKELIAERKEPKGYKRGVVYGRKKQLDEIRNFFEKYLNFFPKNQNKVTLRKYEEFKELIKNEQN